MMAGELEPIESFTQIDGTIEVFLQIDDAVAAEVGERAAGPGVEGDHEIRGREENDSLLRSVGPVGDAAPRGLPRRGLSALAFVEAVDPESLPGRGVDGDRAPAGARGGVEDPSYHDGRGAEVVVGAGAEVSRLPAPGDLELSGVRLVDLIEGRVAGAAEIPAVIVPLALRRAVLRARGLRAESSEQKPDERRTVSHEAGFYERSALTVQFLGADRDPNLR